LNFFNIGTPKSAKLIYKETEEEFYLYVTFQFLPHSDENGKVSYIKRVFDEEATTILENELEDGKKKKAYKCFDALTGETIDVLSVNKTTENKTRVAASYLGVDMGRAVLAAFAVVKDGRVLYKALAETEGLTKKLYSIYEEIATLQRKGKQERKKAREFLKKIEHITKQGIHSTANRIVWARDYYNSHLMLENLTGLKRLPQKKVQQYKRLSDTLTYKSQLKGFPLNTFNPPKAYIEVRPSQTSKLCSRCGFTHPLNRQMELSQKDFKCQMCGYEANADLNAAVNIARLGEYYLQYKEIFLSFDDYLREIAHCPNANFGEYRQKIHHDTWHLRPRRRR
jgi:transposase